MGVEHIAYKGACTIHISLKQTKYRNRFAIERVVLDYACEWEFAGEERISENLAGVVLN